MPVSVKVTVKAARRQRHMSSGWLRKAAQHVDSAADAARAKEKAKLEAVAFGLEMHPPSPYYLRAVEDVKSAWPGQNYH